MKERTKLLFKEDAVQIKVDGQAVGIMGLKGILEAVAEEYADRPDHEVGTELLKRLSRKNYIADSVKKSYAKAFLREFKKSLGKPYEQEACGGVQIKVLGQGCVQCDKLERDLMEVMAEMDFAADLEHVREKKEIDKYGVMGMPALIINGKVMSVGSVPPKTKLKKWLGELA